MVPASFDGCSCFEPGNGGKSEFERLSVVIKSGAEAAETNSKIAAAYLSKIAPAMQLADTEKKEMQGEAGCRWASRPSATLPPDVSVSDVICAFMSSDSPSKPSACVAAPDSERIAQLENENAELQNANTKLWEKLYSAAKENNYAHSHLIEQLYQRIKDLEREASERNRRRAPYFPCDLTWQ